MLMNSCRVCLVSKETDMVSLFSLSGTETYASKIKFCSGISINESDQLPQKICILCLQKVIKACEIKEQCIQTNMILRQKLKNLDSNHISVMNETVYESDLRETFLHDSLKSERKKVEIKHKPKDLKDKTELSSRRKPKDQDYQCFICNQIFIKIRLKNQHIRVDHPEEMICKVCNTRKTSSISTEKCLKDHSLGFDYLCQICAKPFRHKYYLLKHQATFHSEPTNADLFVCDHCGLRTKYKMNLYRHVKSVHLNSHKFPCPFHDKCPETVYTTKEGLNIHLYRTHDVPAPITCNSCHLGFTFVSELKIHRKICGGVTRTPGNGTKNKNFRKFCEIIDNGFRCKVCQKVFAMKQNWSYHYSSTHRDNRTCKICNKEFTNYTNFHRHVTVQHKKIKKFHCDYPGCEKSFGQKGSLINHRNIHSGEKPFSCNFCSFRSGDKSTVIKHKKKMHSQEQIIQQQQKAI
ncbi:CLUMA_CG011935, isoform A [Clunio marinus]|uniref:CLUMA_CG011935, isoform A n=1 Tax=Clunio marinus TaxID=568069 RepID=A0A1J1IK23_9DIPT|nr:CLUMA_CG011935, isoform A [Clunio marinus]